MEDAANCCIDCGGNAACASLNPGYYCNTDLVNCTLPVKGLFVHHMRVHQGSLKAGDEVIAEVHPDEKQEVVRRLQERGEVVAIGGSFRLHEILAETGCELVEIGTTNRTSVRDYLQVMEPGATVMKVHRSNFRVPGFVEEASLVELAPLCAEHGCPLIYDAGSGALYPFAELGLPPQEQTLAADVAAGPDLVTCSGDKLLGGCQAGIVLGRRELIAALRGHPMRRALRVDKTTLAALDAVLTLYLAAAGRPDIPTLSQLALPISELQERARRLVVDLSPDAPAGWEASVAEGSASVGGGSYSNVNIPSCSLLWKGPKQELEACYTRLRRGDPALVGRIGQEGLAVDLRSIAAEELPLVAAAFRTAWHALGLGTGNVQ